MKFNIEVTSDELVSATKFITAFQALSNAFPAGATEVVKAAVKSYNETLAEAQMNAPGMLKPGPK